MVDLYQVGLSMLPFVHPHSKPLHLCQIIIFLGIIGAVVPKFTKIDWIHLKSLGNWVILLICSAPVEVGYIPEMMVVRAGAQTGALEMALV